MPRYFTTYWKNDRWERNLRERNGVSLIHTASDKLRDKEVSPGDFLYVVSVIRGELFVAGRMEVHEFATKQEAEDRFGCSMAFEDNVYAREGAGTTRFYFDRCVPLEITKRLLFVRKNGEMTGLAFDGEERIDKQSLRIVRELTPGSARLLDQFIEQS